MKNQRLTYLFPFFIAILVNACAGSPEIAVTPAEEGLTFLYFYTEG